MEQEATRPAKRLWIWAGAVLGLLVLVYLALAWWTTTRTPAGTTVAGVDVGGQDRNRLRASLESEVAPLAQAPVQVKAAQATAELDPAQAGVTVDQAGTVDKLVGFTLNPVTVFSRLGSGQAVTPVVAVDAQALEVALRDIGAQVHEKPVNGAVTFPEGRVETVTPEDGVLLDIPAAVTSFEDTWPGTGPVDIPTRAVAPTIDQADLDEVLADFAEPAVAGPVHFQVGDGTEGATTDVTLEPQAFAPALSVVEADGALEGRVDGQVLREVLVAPGTGVATEPVDARFELTGGVPTVVPGSTGVTIDPAAAATAFTAAIEDQARTAPIQTVVAQPRHTTEALQNAGVKEPVSEFDTRLTGSAGRVQNIRIAAQEIDMSYLAPGETFSLNDTLGERTRAKGYSSAPVIMNGVMDTGVGGGVSQVATTLFNGAFFAGLEDVDHKAHSLYISRYPEGREATVNYPNVDLKFRNDTQHGVLIQTWLEGGRLHTRFWGTKQYDVTAEKSGRYAYRSPRTITRSGPDCTPSSGSTGFSVDITRIFSQNGAEVKRDGFTTTYIAGPNVVCATPEQ